MSDDLTPKQIAEAALTPRFAALARADADISTLSTWDDLLARDVRLLVPIDVRALLVTAAVPVQAVPTETVVPITAPGSSEAATLPVPPALFGAPVNRPAGVHLHWAMPDGLTRGDAGAARSTPIPAGNPTGLPPLPDRWVVVRMNHGTSTKRAWVLEGDRGEHHDLPRWRERGAAPAGTVTGATGRRIIPSNSLTAVAGGDAAWAATYDAVVDRFAFHDDLADIPIAGRASLVLSYVVAGWWSQPSLDPLRDCTTSGRYQDRAAWLGWLAPEPEGLADWEKKLAAQKKLQDGLQLSPTTETKRKSPRDTGQDFPSIRDEASGGRGDFALPADAALVPRLTLLHGTVAGVTFAGGPDLAPDANTLEVAVGPSSFAALSALLADGEGDARLSSERVLAAFAAGLLPTIDGPNGMVAVDDDRHASAFVAFAGGTRSRPDRIAEGELIPKSQEVPKPRERTAGASKGSPTLKDRPPSASQNDTLIVTLEERGRYRVAHDANSKRNLDLEIEAPARNTRTYRNIAVPAPRYFVPADVAFVVRGAVRSFRHGGDGRFTADGRLACRLPGQVVSGYKGVLEGPDLPKDLRTLGSGAIPPEIDLLFREAVLTDPYRWEEIVAWSKNARGLPEVQVSNRVKAELALRHVVVPTRGRIAGPDQAADTLRAASIAEGDDASPVSTGRWAQPWVPLWCDWEIEVSVDAATDTWTLGPLDFEAADDGNPDTGTPRVVSGRSLLTSAAARALAGQIRQWLSDEDARDQAGQGQIGEAREAELADAAIAAEGLDVVAGAFHGIRETLLGLDPTEAGRARIDAQGATTSLPLVHDVPLLIAGGGARINRLRLVDAFGRWRDIPAARLTAAEIATSMAHPSGAPRLTLTPRFQRPSRLAFRLVDPRVADGEPDIEARVDQQFPAENISPIAGWLMPDHVDEALEVFDASGTPLGQLMHDELTGLVVWEGAPGRPGPIGGPPDPGSDPGARHVTRLAAGLVAADVAARHLPRPPNESALSALLRAVDTTLWTVDPLGSLGTGAVAGLVGRPIAVVRAVLRLDILDDMNAVAFADEAARTARARAYGELAARAITVRLGTLTRTDDSLLAYAIDDDYSQLRLVGPEVHEEARTSGRQQGQLTTYGAGSGANPPPKPIRHPYVSGPTDVTLRSRHTVRLTLLMNPGGKAHATAGLLPRKSLALAREWFHDALLKLSPSFRVGPVLVDPTTIRLPLVTGLGEGQTFTRRNTPLTWRDDAIVAATQTAYLPEQPSTLQEGWIRIVQQPPDEPTP
jgi:hypothetical protein